MRAAFDAADAYDANARVQRDVAADLARHILAGPKPRRVLEIGCGTGFLGAALMDGIADSEWWMTDLSPAMVKRARARFAAMSAVHFRAMDGERPDIDGPFDLICSSLAMQWFADLPGSVMRLRGLLSPGGRLCFTTLAEGSFREWIAAHHGLPAGTPDWPAAEELRAMGLAVNLRDWTEIHADSRSFLRALKAIGAGTARPGHRPLPPPAMRQTMRRFEETGCVARYVVATCEVRA